MGKLLILGLINSLDKQQIFKNTFAKKLFTLKVTSIIEITGRNYRISPIKSLLRKKVAFSSQDKSTIFLCEYYSKTPHLKIFNF